MLDTEYVLIFSRVVKALLRTSLAPLLDGSLSLGELWAWGRSGFRMGFILLCAKAGQFADIFT